MKTEAQLHVGDIAVAVEYYTTRLGFDAVFEYGDPPFYAQVQREGAALNLRHVDSPVIDGARRDAEQLLSATITVDDAQALHDEYRRSGADIAQPLRLEPWGARTFIVRDPDGNLLLFAGASG